MSDLLFDIPTSLSPKLAWLERHGLTTKRQENGSWLCILDDENFSKGATDEEACAEFCIEHRLRHWSEEA